MDINDKYKARIIVTWLRKCQETSTGSNDCKHCPFDDGIVNCVDNLQEHAADMIEKLAGLKKEGAR